MSFGWSATGLTAATHGRGPDPGAEEAFYIRRHLPYVVAAICLGVLIALTLIAAAEAHHCKPGTHCVELRKGIPSCKASTRGSVERALCTIRRSADHWHQSRSFMRYLAYCESRYNARAYNPSGASGLFQFMPSTFDSTPYGWHSIWNPKWNALGAGWMLAVGRRGEWAC